MTHQIRPKRIPLGIIVTQTRRMLFSLVLVTVLGLFVGQLVLVNQLSMRGYMLSKEVERSKSLAFEYEQVEANIAHNQTQEYVEKITEKQYLQGSDQRVFVRIKNTVTAQAENELYQ